MAGRLEDLHKNRMNDIEYRSSTIILKFLNDLALEMENREMTQAQLAKKLGISEAAVSKFFYLDMDSNPKISTLLKYAEAVELKLEIRTAPQQERRENYMDNYIFIAGGCCGDYKVNTEERIIPEKTKKPAA